MYNNCINKPIPGMQTLQFQQWGEYDESPKTGSDKKTGIPFDIPEDDQPTFLFRNSTTNKGLTGETDGGDLVDQFILDPDLYKQDSSRVKAYQEQIKSGSNSSIPLPSKTSTEGKDGVLTPEGLSRLEEATIKAVIEGPKHSSPKDTSDYLGKLDQLARLATAGSEKASDILVNLAYHPDPAVRGRIESFLPGIYAQSPEDVGALCVELMRHSDPKLREIDEKAGRVKPQTPEDQKRDGGAWKLVKPPVMFSYIAAQHMRANPTRYGPQYKDCQQIVLGYLQMSGLAGLKLDPKDPWRMLDLNRPVSLEEANIGSDVLDGMLDPTKSIRYGGTHVVSTDRNSIVPGAVAGIALQHFKQFAKDGKMRATVIDLFDPSTQQYGTVLLYGASMAFLTKGDPSQEIDLPESFRNVVDLIRETGIKSCRDTFESETVGIDPSLLAPPSNGEKQPFGYSLHNGEGIMGRMLLRYFSDLNIPDVKIAGSLRAPVLSKNFLEALRVAPKDVRTHVQINERLRLISGYAHRPEQRPQDPMIKI